MGRIHLADRCTQLPVLRKTSWLYAPFMRPGTEPRCQTQAQRLSAPLTGSPLATREAGRASCAVL